MVIKRNYFTIDTVATKFASKSRQTNYFSLSLAALPLTIALECSFETQHLLLLYLKEVQEPCPVSNLSKSWHAQNKLKLLRTNKILTIYRNVSY